MKQHEKLNYVEFGTRDLAATKDFFEKAFDWRFLDYGPDYTAFSDEGLDGGFYVSDQVAGSERGGALLVFYSEDLEGSLSRVQEAGGEIMKAIFEFPGGRRFQFCEPGGNEFAVWSEPAGE